MSICPYCGKHVELVRSRAGWEPMTSLESDAPWMTSDSATRPDFAEYIKSEPVRQPGWESDVLVPAGQALLSGLIVTGCVGIISTWYWWPWSVSVSCGAAATLAVWLAAVADGRSLLRRVEHIVNWDIDGDGVVGETVRHEYSVTERRADGTERWQLLVDIDPDVMQAVARGLLAGRMGVHDWTGTLTRSQFGELRDRLIEGDLARWNSRNRNQGWSLTRKGADLFRQIATDST